MTSPRCIASLPVSRAMGCLFSGKIAMTSSATRGVTVISVMPFIHGICALGILRWLGRIQRSCSPGNIAILPEANSTSYLCKSWILRSILCGPVNRYCRVFAVPKMESPRVRCNFTTKSPSFSKCKPVVGSLLLFSTRSSACSILVINFHRWCLPGLFLKLGTIIFPVVFQVGIQPSIRMARIPGFLFAC